MANSSSNGTRNFLIKLCEDDAPARIGVPTDVAQWEGGTFLTGKPRKEIRRKGFPVIRLPEGQTEPPRPGDRLYIWINKDRHGKKTGGGKGLTATAEVARAAPPDWAEGVRVVNVLLYDPIGVLNDSHLGVLQHDVFKDIVESRNSKLRYISPNSAKTITDEAGRRSIRNIKQKFPEPSAPTSSLPIVIASSAPEAATAAGDGSSGSLSPAEEESIAVGERERTSLIEQRANQGTFRYAVIQRDGGKCVGTGCKMIQVLEAAHLIPYATGHEHRDKPANGILLRADIHLLFDRYLMAINPETMKIWLDDRLLDSAYARLKDKTVRTAAGLDYLRFQYDTATGKRAIPGVGSSLDLAIAI